MSTFFTSDPHFFHKNILKYCPESRKYSSIDEHNEAIVQGWNDRIRNNDDVYCLGDMSFGKDPETEEILSRLRGRVHIILGNHDRNLSRIKLPKNFVEVSVYKELRIGKDNLVLFHFPIESWNRDRYGSLMLHGHTHGNTDSHHPLSKVKNRMDVGVDTHPKNYPWEFEEIKTLLKE